jgi:hypothetical protein
MHLVFGNSDVTNRSQTGYSNIDNLDKMGSSDLSRYFSRASDLSR